MNSTPSSTPNLPVRYEGSRSWLDRILRISRQPAVKVYHGYGDANRVLVLGHVLRASPVRDEYYGNGVFRNAVSLLRLFAVKPAAGLPVRIRFGNEQHEAVAGDDGFFRCEWKTAETLEPGWLPIRVELADAPEIFGEGKLYIPPPARYGFVSDIDDTFLISHSANLRKRLEVLFTKNPRTRKPFEGVVEHYRELSLAGTTTDAPNPFFYVSSSEWNLYDYIKEFCRHHGLPEGVFLLREIKQLSSFFKTGQGSHSGKYDRIARIMEEFPELHYVLLGDDSQQDPEIYLRLVEAQPGKVQYVYLRHRVKGRLPEVRKVEAALKKSGVEVCYFTHSKTAREHSRRVGLTTGEVVQ